MDILGWGVVVFPVLLGGFALFAVMGLLYSACFFHQRRSSDGLCFAC